MLFDVFVWGTAVGVIHVMVTGALYGNPWVDGIYERAQAEEPGVRAWPSKPRYLATQIAGTQIEVWVLALGWVVLAPLLPGGTLADVLSLGALFTGIRVYPRFWNMWIQSTYPGRLLAIEFAAGVVSTFTVVGGMALLAGG